MNNELLYAGAIAGIIEAIFWVGVGAYWLRRKMMKRKTKPKWDWVQRVADYRKSRTVHHNHHDHKCATWHEDRCVTFMNVS